MSDRTTSRDSDKPTTCVACPTCHLLVPVKDATWLAQQAQCNCNLVAPGKMNWDCPVHGAFAPQQAQPHVCTLTGSCDQTHPRAQQAKPEVSNAAGYHRCDESCIHPAPQPEMPTREMIAKALYDSPACYCADMDKCLELADAVLFAPKSLPASDGRCTTCKKPLPCWDHPAEDALTPSEEIIAERLGILDLEDERDRRIIECAEAAVRSVQRGDMPAAHLQSALDAVLALVPTLSKERELTPERHGTALINARKRVEESLRTAMGPMMVEHYQNQIAVLNEVLAHVAAHGAGEPAK